MSSVDGVIVKCPHVGCNAKFRCPVGATKVRCPSCRKIAEVRKPERKMELVRCPYSGCQTMYKVPDPGENDSPKVRCPKCKQVSQLEFRRTIQCMVCKGPIYFRASSRGKYASEIMI